MQVGAERVTGDAAVGARLALIEDMAAEGRITASASSLTLDYRYNPNNDLWTPKTGASISGTDLRNLAVTKATTIVVTSRP